MRLLTCTAMGLALLTSACGDSGETQQKTRSISVRSVMNSLLM